MKKKAINMVLLFIFIGSLISLSANAAFGDIFRAGLNPIEDFFRGGWQNYEKTVVFVVFFFLFFSAYLIGMKKSMGELTRAHITFAFVAAFLSSFIITVSMRFDWINLKYIAWFLIAVLILFLMYSLLSKMFEKHKFLAFLLALLLTALLLWLIWYLMSEGRPLERFGRISDVFGRFGKEKIPKREPLGAGPPIGREEPGAAPEVKPPVTPEGKGWFGRNWWVILVIIALITAGAGGIGKLRGHGFFGGVKDFYTAPLRPIKRAPRHLRVIMLNRKLKNFINRVLKILKDPRLTEKERNEVLLNLQEAINLTEMINKRWLGPREKMFDDYKKSINEILKKRGVEPIG